MITRVAGSTLMLMAVLLAGCGHPTTGDLEQLKRFESSQNRAIVAETIACDAADPACVRLWLIQGAACEQMSEQMPSTAERAAMRACAVRDFRQAATLAPRDPANPDRFAATRGLANALKIARDNEADPTARRADSDQLRVVLTDL